MRGTASLRALLVGLLALPSVTAAGEVEPEREIIELVPEQKAGAGAHSFLAPFRSLFRGPGYWYGERTLKVDTTPQGASLDIFYIRANFQKRFEQGQSPATIVLPSRVESAHRDTVEIRALLDGYREQVVHIPVRSGQSEILIDLAPLPNSLVAVAHTTLAGRSALAFLTDEALAFRLQKADAGIAVILTETAITPRADETIHGVSDSLIASLEALQLGEDLVVQVGFTDAARDEIEVRSLQGFDPIRGLHHFTLNLVPADHGAGGVRRARAALARIRAHHAQGCALAFDEALRSELDPADLARALAPKGAFTDPFLRAAMKRLGELSPDGVVSLTDGSSYRVAAPIELAAAGNQASEARGYLVLLRQFVAELEPALHRRETLRGLVAPEVGTDRFAEILEGAEARERSCLANGG